MNVISPEKITAFRTFMQEHDFFYIIGHKEPDGDCIASCLGLKAIAEHYKKPYQLLSAGPFKRIEIQKYEPYFTNEMTFLSENERKKTGLLICDCSEFHRLGEIDGDLKNLDSIKEVFDEVDLLIKPSQRKSFMLYLRRQHPFLSNCCMKIFQAQLQKTLQKSCFSDL